MKKELHSLPKAMKKQVASRFWIGVFASAVFLLIVVFTRDIILGLPCIFLSAYLFISGGILLYRSLARQYIVVHGTCVNIERTGLRKRIKAVYIQSQDKVIKVVVQGQRKRLDVGCELALYISVKTRLYEQGDYFVVFNYYALELEN